MTVFSERLIKLHREKGDLKKDIAEAIGVSPRQYKRYETGEQVPTLSVITALADYFGVSVDYLTGRIDNILYNKFALAMHKVFAIYADAKGFDKYNPEHMDEFLKTVNVSPDDYTKWIYGISLPDPFAVIRIANYFNANIDIFNRI